MAPVAEIFVVDDDPIVCKALFITFSLEGYQVSVFPDGESFLLAAQQRIPACVILDVYMPGRSGLEILKDLRAESYEAPILVISARGDIPMAVEAIKSGAFDFIEKPLDPDAFVERVREAISTGEKWRASKNAFGDLLTPREYDVLQQIASGSSNKEAGQRLGISWRTVEVHRARIMEKFGAKNSADLIRIVLKRRKDLAGG
jgi:two-component system, LuxR family, response regulator FixJ